MEHKFLTVLTKRLTQFKQYFPSHFIVLLPLQEFRQVTFRKEMVLKVYD
jgi:hypothetical protein